MNDKVIIFASQQYGYYWSGLGSYSTWLIDAFARQYRVYVICPEAEGRRVSSSVQLIPVKPCSLDITHGHWFSLSRQYGKKIEQLAQGNNVAFIHFTDAREAFFSVRYLNEQLRAKIVGTLHDFYFAAFRCNPFFYRKRYLDGFKRWAYYFFVNRIENYTYKRIPFLIANTHYVREKVSSAYQLDIKKIKTIYIGLPVEWVKTAQTSRQYKDKLKQIIFVGGNLQRKGIVNLGKAVKMVAGKYPELRVVIIGKDPNLKKVRTYLKKIDADQYFDFKGYVAPQELPEFYRQSAALVMPAQIEAYGLVFLEAMACGCPVIGTNKGGTPELFEMAGAGKSIDPHDIPGLAGVIEEALGSAAERSDLLREVKIKYLSETIDETKKYLQYLLT